MSSFRFDFGAADNATDASGAAAVARAPAPADADAATTPAEADEPSFTAFEEAPAETDAAPGDALVADWRLKHRGLANRTREDRPLLYLTYARPWFVDKYNFSSERYAPLPPLCSMDATRSERADIRDMA